MDLATTPWQDDWNEGGQIGQGGQGVVIELQSKTDPTKRAVLKRLTERWRGNKQAKERMAREIEAMTTLNGAQAKVPKVFDSFLEHTGSEPYFIMEFISGTLFKDWLEKNAPTNIETALTITRAVGETIELCHSQNIGHRDLKPANIILKDDDPKQPFVLDFGISFDSMQSMIVTKDGDVFWNEFIILPECQDRLGGHQDLRSDLTALAGIYFNCIVGEAPAVLLDGNGMPPQRRFFTKLQAAITDPPKLMRLKSFFDTSFAVAIDRRFQNFPDFHKQLDQFDGGMGDSESLADVSNAYVGDLLQRDRGAQLVSMKASALNIFGAIQIDLAKKIDGESLSEFKLKTGNSNLGPIFELHSKGLPPTMSEGDRLLGDTLNVQFLSSNKHPRVPVCIVVPVAVGMHTHFLAGGWIAERSNRISKPMQTVDWIEVGSIEQLGMGLEKEALIQACVEAGYIQLKNQLRKMNLMLSEES